MNPEAILLLAAIVFGALSFLRFRVRRRFERMAPGERMTIPSTRWSRYSAGSTVKLCGVKFVVVQERGDELLVERVG